MYTETLKNKKKYTLSNFNLNPKNERKKSNFQQYIVLE